MEAFEEFIFNFVLILLATKNIYILSKYLNFPY